MTKNPRHLAHAAIIAALYAVLTHMQNTLLPGSANMAIQFRASEALCILAFFTPAAIPGLTLGCLVYNLTSGMALPLDFLFGSLATFLAAWAMWRMRKLTIAGFPLPGMLMPAITNALLVGWELHIYIGGSFGINALYVAIGELAVLTFPNKDNIIIRPDVSTELVYDEYYSAMGDNNHNVYEGTVRLIVEKSE